MSPTSSSGTGAWIRRLAVAFVLVTFVPVATTACFGQFRLTKKLYRFNRDIDDDKWIQWFAFIVMSLPYSLGFGIDVVIANSVEFWSGQNPIAAAPGTTRVVRGQNGETVRMTLREDRRIELSVTRPGEPEQRVYLQREAAAVSARDPDGNLLARVTDVAGTPALISGSLAGGGSR